MIKKLKLGLLILCLPLTAMATQFELGKHYNKLNAEKSAKPNVTEFFSFFCGHCYKMEPAAKELANSLPADVAFIKSHVNFLPGRSSEIQSLLSRAYLVAKEKKVAPKMTDAIFNYIHRSRAGFNDVKDVRNLFILNGMEGKDFDDLVYSMPVNISEQNFVSEQTKYSENGGLTGVPTFIVNGQYKVNYGQLKSAKEFSDLVKFLLEKE